MLLPFRGYAASRYFGLFASERKLILVGTRCNSRGKNTPNGILVKENGGEYHEAK